MDDVEFYHDQGGVTLGKAALTDSVKKNICGKVTRELVPGSLKIYPMKGYGFVEMAQREPILLAAGWRPGIMARLTLPVDITRDEVRRLKAFVDMLVVGDGDEEKLGVKPE